MVEPGFSVKGLSKGSHVVVSVSCDFKRSPNCKVVLSRVWKDVLRYRKVNKGLDICLQCSRFIKSSRRTNPNTKYKHIDDGMFGAIDNQEKAYLLGWVASDGSVRKAGFVINIKASDLEILKILRGIVKGGLISNVIKDGRPMVSFSVSSTRISQDICKHLQIAPKKKDKHVRFPVCLEGNLKLASAFIRGYFDGDGTVRTPFNNNNTRRAPSASITSNSLSMLISIEKAIGVKGKLSQRKTEMCWEGASAIDFLGRIYDDSSISLERKSDLYHIWRTWVPGICVGDHKGSRIWSKTVHFKAVKTRNDAVLPNKTLPSDSGYDLTLLEKVKEYGDVEFYDTGVKVQPSFGYWFLLAPRSSMAKSGYALANEVGIIDRAYVGNILVALRKVNKSAPDIVLPSKCVQIIPMPAVHLGPVVEVDSFDCETTRGEGGFGSTDLLKAA